MLITENLPTGMTFVGATWSDGSALVLESNEVGTGIVKWRIAEVWSGDLQDFNLLVKLDANLRGETRFSNMIQTTPNAGDINPVPDNNIATAEVVVIGPTGFLSDLHLAMQNP